VLISSLPHVRYLTGFTGSAGLAVVTRSGAWLVTDERYREQSRIEVRGWKRIVTWGVLWDAVAAASCLDRCRRVGFESAHLSHAAYRRLRRLLPACSLRAQLDVVEGLAVRKDASEIVAIACACAITDRVFASILDCIRPGVREADLAAEISRRQRLEGAEGDAFEPIVAGGERSALPHAGATARRLRRGDMVVLDFGCRVNGYHSDMTRTVAVGRASAQLRHMHAAVDAARLAALAVVRPGVQARMVDAAARRVLADAGLGRLFPHALGHGLGLRLHERPRVSARSDEVLRESMVVTIEPGVYVPGYGGIRIEDDVAVTATGARLLSGSTRELLIL
jgi:Xaa-Pro aminopeptidase